LAKTNPIVIIDEPQRASGTATVKAISQFNPLFVLRYSATHRQVLNMVYRLDAIDAYNQHLVKKIEVKGIHQQGSTATNGYVYLEEILIGKGNPQARLHFDMGTTSGTKQVNRLVGEGFNLYEQSGHLREYKNHFVVESIDGRKGTVRFLNGIELHQGEAVGKVSEAVERRMIDGIIDFEETRVHEVMVPRMDMVTLEASEPLEEAMKVFIEHGHSRLPVYEESLDNIVGVLYVKDTLKHLIGAELSQAVGGMMRKPLFVPETIRTVELLETMRRDHIHIAVVVDEYGGVAGLVTMEDILEEIVGEIQDEYDQESPDILEMEDGTYRVQGTTSLEDLSEALDYPFESEDAESLAGLVLLLAGGFPQVNDAFEYEDWRIRVVDLEDHRIKVLDLERMKPEKDA